MDEGPDGMGGMKAALALAEQAASQNEVPVGAVVMLGDRVVGSGYNLRETQQSPMAHAEVLAIESAAQTLKNWRLQNCVLYVTLEPCMMCLAACQQARVQTVIYGAKDLKGGALSLGYRFHEDERTHHRFSVTYSDQEPRCSAILTEFFSKKRGHLYHRL